VNLKPFQQATVNRAVAALTAAGGSRRFLVADEVGLGKTRVAQGVIQRLAERSIGPPLKVFYVCSSVTIAAQNRDAILEALPSSAARKAATVEVDRLTMLPTAKAPAGVPFVLYTLTPQTLPGSRRTGRGGERAFIWSLLCRALPGLSRHSTLERVMQHGVGNDAWPYYRDEGARSAAAAPAELATAVRRELAERFEMSAAAHRSTLIQHLKRAIRDDESCRNLIHQTRMAVAHAALRTISPDLVVLDEFQRFFEELPLDRDEDEDGDAQQILRIMLEGARESSRGARRRAPSVLLLSATPYPAFATWHGGGYEHHRDFFRLLGFLAGTRAHAEVRALKKAFREYRELLEVEPVGGTRAPALREEIQHSLVELMSRTERPRRIGRPDDVRVERVPAPLDAVDVRVFRHLRDAASPTDKGFVTAYWSSIPFPLQSMDRTYQFRLRATPASLGALRGRAALTWEAIRNFDPVPAPHPRWRQLLEAVPPELLALPWLPPTRPWWALGGAFRAAVERVGADRCSKALVFSRFRAVPRALAVVASYAGEQYCYDVREQRRRAGDELRFEYHIAEGGRPRQNWRRRPAGSFSFPIASKHETALRSFAMFVPMPELARIGDPLPQVERINNCELRLEKAVELVARALRRQLGLPVGRRGQVPAARWAVELERRGPRSKEVEAALRAWASSIQVVGQEQNASAGVRNAVEDALRPTDDLVGGPTDRELHELAHVALLAPANVLYRVVERVFGAAQRPIHLRERVSHVASTSVRGLRGYLDAPEFHLLLRSRRSQHPGAVRQAVWDGNLESVLDEYLALQRGLGSEFRENDVRPSEQLALERLGEALSLQAINLQMSSMEGDSASDFRVRCHAALPFGLGADIAAETTGAFRSDAVRKAFNSPFRPHLLATTSIGQEGLDFHTFCDHIVHWDLPHNPVDLEQREGRVDRYAGLAQRKALARANGGGRRRDAGATASPWVRIAAAQVDEDEGLSPWWVHPDAKIRRSVFVPPFSRVTTDLDRLLESLSLYRLALGQVDQEALVSALQRRIEGSSPRARKELLKWLESVRIDLKPAIEEAAGARSSG
jgi:hypothetical protein